MSQEMRASEEWEYKSRSKDNRENRRYRNNRDRCSTPETDKMEAKKNRIVRQVVKQQDRESERFGKRS